MPGDHMFLMLSSSLRPKSTMPGPKTFADASTACLMRSRIRLVTGDAMMEPRYLLIAPTLGAMDMPLSLRMTMMSRPEWPALFIPS